jgi:MerR family transcriptional regulator, copper efflux regulator
MPNGGTREEVPTAMVMTIGALSRRTGVPVKMLRAYEDLGLIYTVGRSAGNYRLFGEEALWCRRGRRPAGSYLHESDEPVGPRLATLLQAVRARTEQRIGVLQQRLKRLDAFEATCAAELAGQADFRDQDPRSRVGRA